METTASGIVVDSRPSLISSTDLARVNTQEFRREALHFEKHGKYCLEYPGTKPHKDYWDEQLRRCVEGYSVGGVEITGQHYGYLNFAQIRLTEGTEKKAGEVSKKKAGIKKVFFPDFWDGDYLYFHEQRKARLDGEHLLVLKTRRRGYSFKNGWIASNIYNTQRSALVILGAYLKEYLYPEGTMAMSSSYLDFLNEHTAWKKRRQVVNKTHHRKASFIETFPDGTTVEKGYKSQILALTFQNNPEAARGKDAALILLEEAGKFPNLKASYMASRPCVEDGDTVTGQIIGFGTGGGSDSNWEDFEEMFYSPKQFGLRAYENEYDEGAMGTFCSFFVPDYLNKRGYIDAQGISDIEGARNYELELVASKKKEGASSSNIDAHVAEYPHKPAEAFMRIGSNNFPQAELLAQYNKLKTSKIHEALGVPGDFSSVSGKLKFMPNDKIEPVYNYPHRRDDNIKGGVVVYQPPVRVADEVPSDLYYICHDPYAQDSSSGSSLGAAYVMKRISNAHKPDDMIVASYIGRPDMQDMYNETLFKLAEYYNCKIGFESDRGDTIGYAKRFKKLHLLEAEFELDYAKDLKSQVNRSHGMHMTEGRKRQGELYLRDWLLTPRGKDAEGRTKLNLHYIYDPALLQELLKYNPIKGNFDRVSAMLIGMYYQKELLTFVPDLPVYEENGEGFFDRVKFI